MKSDARSANLEVTSNKKTHELQISVYEWLVIPGQMKSILPHLQKNRRQ
jgi:hypothetical protein